MNREEAIQAIMDETGRTKEQAEAFIDLLGSAFRRRGWVPGNPLPETAIVERLDTFLGEQDREG